MMKPNMMKPVKRVRPYIPEEDIPTILKLIEQTLNSGALTMGPHVQNFEQAFADIVGVKHAVAVSTGTAALEIALRGIGVEGREVIVPTQTFVASANSVILAGGKPVFAEIHPDTLCLDPDDVERRITPNTKAIMIVHMGGLISPHLTRLQELADQYGLALVEDAAHAHGASINGRSAGALGTIGCFSFYPTKVITTAEGGMLTTDDDELAELARSLRNHGANPRGADYIHVSTNWRMSELSAAIGVVQLARLASFVQRRNQIAQCYTQALASMPGIKPLPTYPEVRHSYWSYLAMLDEGVQRERVAATLRTQFGVDTAWPYDPPCHLQPVFQAAVGSRLGDLPQSERLLARHIALPMHMCLTDDDVRHVIESVGLALQQELVAL